MKFVPASTNPENRAHRIEQGVHSAKAADKLRTMQREEAISRLRQGRDILRARGVRSLALFGSTARGDAQADSDIDVLVELDDRRKFSLIDLSDIKFLIGDLAGARADLALRGRLRPCYREAIEKDAIAVF